MILIVKASGTELEAELMLTITWTFFSLSFSFLFAFLFIDFKPLPHLLIQLIVNVFFLVFRKRAFTLSRTPSNAARLIFLKGTKDRTGSFVSRLNCNGCLFSLKQSKISQLWQFCFYSFTTSLVFCQHPPLPTPSVISQPLSAENPERSTTPYPTPHSVTHPPLLLKIQNYQHTHTHTRAHARTHAHTRTHARARTHAHARTHTHTHTNPFTHMP